MDSLDIKFGKYTLVDKIGDGGMAEVYRARVAGIGGFEKVVALKKIHPSLSSNERFQKNFVNEARICGQLHHHNVVEVYEFDQVGDAFYLAMEYIDGLNLEDLLDAQRKRGESLPLPVVVSVMMQVLEGLAYAHKALSLDGRPLNVIHRDLKPSNILIDRSGVVKIVDFGVAKADMNRYVTQEMTAKGTASYMAPEQVLGEKRLTHLVDIFATGSILFELLTLRRLFDGDHVFAILKSVATVNTDEVVKQLPANAQVFAPILKRLLAPKPAERAQSAEEVARELHALGLHEIGPRTLERFLRDVEEDMEESQQTLIDLSGGVTAEPEPDPKKNPLYQTGPTRVAFLPDAARSRAAALGTSPTERIQVPERHTAPERTGTTTSRAVRAAISPDEGMEDDVHTRQTTGPTRVTPSLLQMSQEPSRPPVDLSAHETTQTDRADLAKATANLPAAGRPDEDLATRSLSSSRPDLAPPSDPTRPGLPTWLDSDNEPQTVIASPQRLAQLAAEATPPLSLNIPEEDVTTSRGHLLRAVILIAVVALIGIGLFATKPGGNSAEQAAAMAEHAVNLDFSSNLDISLQDARAAGIDPLSGGVDVFVNTQFVGRTPFTHGLTFKGKNNQVQVEARREGYTSQSKVVMLREGGAATETVRFELSPATP